MGERPFRPASPRHHIPEMRQVPSPLYSNRDRQQWEVKTFSPISWC